MLMGNGRLAGCIVDSQHHGFFTWNVFQQLLLQHRDLFRRRGFVGVGLGHGQQAEGGDQTECFHEGMACVVSSDFALSRRWIHPKPHGGASKRPIFRKVDRPIPRSIQFER
ncbi:hypothetical protein D3C75_1140360 [compost metagenome]